MEKTELKERIQHNLLDLAPDIYDQIQLTPPPDFLILENERFKQSPAFSQHQRCRRFYCFAAVAAACLLLFLLPGVFREPSVYVLLEINPSICLDLNTEYQICGAKGLNSDGVQLLKELNFEKNEPLEQVIEHLFTQLQTDNYLHNDGGILISVSRTEETFYRELKEKLQNEINCNLTRIGISNFTVAFQFTEHTKNTGRKSLEKELAEKYGLSPEEVASLNIQELINYAQKYGIPEIETSETEAPETEVSETEAPETEIPETEAPETEAPETEAPETEAPNMETVTKTVKETLSIPDSLPSSNKTSPAFQQTEITTVTMPEKFEEAEQKSETKTITVSTPETPASAIQEPTSSSDKNSNQEETSEAHSSVPSKPKKKSKKTSKQAKKKKKNSSAKRKKKNSSTKRKKKSSSAKRKKKSSSAKKKKQNNLSQKNKASSTTRKKSTKPVSVKAEKSKNAEKQDETSKSANSKNTSSLNAKTPSSKSNKK